MLRLLALQVTDTTWQVTEAKEKVIDAPESKGFAHRQLVLVDMDNDDAIKGIADATDWVMELVGHYLASGITPSFLKEEASRAEQWRQVLTLQTQDLSRRSLEAEARQEQLKGLDQRLQLGQQRLREQWKSLIAHAETLGVDTAELVATMEFELSGHKEKDEDDD
ncbi:MAG: hypothetical protein ACFCBU_00135 [Cyanophyceae cyanobacterium]